LMMRDGGRIPCVSLPATVVDGQVRSRLVGEFRWRLADTFAEGDLRLSGPAALRQPAVGTNKRKSQELPVRPCQKGRTMTITTMTTISSVGTSLAIR